MIGKLNPDFIHNNGSKKVIEVFGDTYHNPKKVLERTYRGINRSSAERPISLS